MLSTDRVQNLDSKGDTKADHEPFETEEQELLEKQSPTKRLNRKQSNVLAKEQSFVAEAIGKFIKLIKFR